MIAVAPLSPETQLAPVPVPIAVSVAPRLMEVLVATPAGSEGRRLRAQLEGDGYRVVEAADGHKALELLRAQRGPSVALLDEDLPGLGGAEVVRRLRAMTTDRYVYTVLMVGRASRDAALGGREAGADDCLNKPARARELKLYLHSAERIVAMERRLAEARDRFRTQATRDPLTGLSNRLDIMGILDREVGRTERQATPLAVIMVDLDHFKRINDTYGHPSGDSVIREAARRMNDAVRVYDSVGRYGGEEFIIVLPGADAAIAGRVAERLRKAIACQAVNLSTGSISVTVSLGVAATGGQDTRSAEELIKRADQALYQAKNAGRDRVVVAGPQHTNVAPSLHRQAQAGLI